MEESQQSFPMKDGTDDTSYAKNSSLQEAVLKMARPLLDEAVQDFLAKNSPEFFTLVDMGSSSGPNALLLVSNVINATCGTVRELQVFLNDLPGNDFNTLFKFLQSFYHDLAEMGDRGPRCFISAWPRSFYERVFPTRSIHFVHSSLSIHWLTQVPPGIEGINKGDIYISTSPPPEVQEAYLHQFQRDFSKFLQLRSEELVPGGRMLLTLNGRPSPNHADDNHSRFWGLLATVLRELTAEGLIDEGAMRSFNVSCYAPYIGEVKQVLISESSFTIDRLETNEVDICRYIRVEDRDNPSLGRLQLGKGIARIYRAIIEPSMTRHFSRSIMDDIFERFARAFAKSDIHNTKFVMISMALTHVAAEKM